MSPRRIPRDVSGRELAAALRRAYDYEETRRTGSHARLTTQRGGEHHVTVPMHDSLRIGTLAGIIDAVGEHLGLDRDAVVEALFG
jgi:predicted RNA binding protein YcfA (HicA-like mRNA interferase family)